MTTQTIWKSPICKMSNTKAMRWHPARYATCMRGAEEHLEHRRNLLTDITQTYQYHRQAHISLKIRGVEKNQKHNNKSINRCLRRILSIHRQRGITGWKQTKYLHKSQSCKNKGDGAVTHSESRSPASLDRPGNGTHRAQEGEEEPKTPGRDLDAVIK